MHNVFGRVLPLRKRVVIGVDLGLDAIRLAKISHAADTRHTLSNYADVPLPAGIAPESENFAGFLRSTLNSFCGNEPRAEIWTAISSSQVDTRYLRVPKVPRRELAKAVYGPIGAMRPLMKPALSDTADQSVCTLYIGREFSRIDIFESSHLVLSRVIKAGVRSMLDALKEDLTERRHGDPVDLEQFISVEQLAGSERQDQSFFHLLAQRMNMREEEIFSMVLPAMDRLIGQVERTLKHYALHFDNNQVGNLYIFGEVSIHKRIADLIAEQFGIRSQIIDLFALPNLNMDVPAPGLQNERNHLIPAIALALSSNSITPDFLLAHEDKTRMGRIDWVNRALAGALALALLIIIGISFSHKSQIHIAAARIAALQQKLEQQKPPVDRNLVNALVRQSLTQAEEVKLAAGKYLPLAIFSELAALTSAQIRLLHVEADLTGPPAEKKKSDTPAALKIKGIVSGDPLSLDVVLADYIVNLRTSPLFRNAVIKERTLKNHAHSQVLNFTIHLGLER